MEYGIEFSGIKSGIDYRVWFDEEVERDCFLKEFGPDISHVSLLERELDVT